MAERYVPRHSIGNEINAKTDKSSFVSTFLNPAAKTGDASKIEYRQIPVEEITPRFVNKYRQSRIAELAQSIHNTNDRLIHPIVLVKAEDLPQESEVRKAIIEQGKNIDDYHYIIVSGERRYHAWMLLREQEAGRIKNKLGMTNRFDTITANVLSKEEAANEQSFYADANNMARHLSPAECVWFIKDALSEVTTNEQKREALIQLNGGSDVGIDPDPAKAARRFRVDTYIRPILEKEFGITDWTDATIRNMGTVAKNCDNRVIDALLSDEFPLREARVISTLPQETQVELVEMFKQEPAAYQARLADIRSGTPAKTQKVTHADTRRQLRASLKRIRSEREEIARLAQALGAKYNRNELDALKKYDAFIEDLAALIDNTK